MQKYDDDESTWWCNYVDTEFGVNWVKCCSRKFVFKYKISIPGVSFASVRKHICCFNEKSHDDIMLQIDIDKNKQYIKSVPHENETADWLIDFVFNGGQQYIFTKTQDNIQYTHYNDTFKWEQSNKCSLIFEGRIKYRSLRSQTSNHWKILH